MDRFGVAIDLTGATQYYTTVGFEGQTFSDIGAPTAVFPPETPVTVGSVEAVDVGAGVSVAELNGYKATYEVQMVPTVELIEVPFFTTTTSVLSTPTPSRGCHNPVKGYKRHSGV